MGNACSCNEAVVEQQEQEDPWRSSQVARGQTHLLYRKNKPIYHAHEHATNVNHEPTQLVVRVQDGLTHMYAVRTRLEEQRPQPVSHYKQQQQQSPEQRPPQPQPQPPLEQVVPSELFSPQAMAPTPSLQVPDWVCVSPELQIYVCDTCLTPSQCNHLVSVSEHVCRGQYAAYTYAKQTLGCREYPLLAVSTQQVVHRVVHAIQNSLSRNLPLRLDEREPHVVKYDTQKKERQKLDMHTDKSEWTFLIALSNGSGMDYDGGGTYFEGLNATVHVQRGHALVFPGKLRHCGQRISKGVRFLLVGFLVDASANAANSAVVNATPTAVKANASMGAAAK